MMADSEVAATDAQDEAGDENTESNVLAKFPMKEHELDEPKVNGQLQVKEQGDPSSMDTDGLKRKYGVPSQLEMLDPKKPKTDDTKLTKECASGLYASVNSHDGDITELNFNDSSRTKEETVEIKENQLAARNIEKKTIELKVPKVKPNISIDSSHMRGESILNLSQKPSNPEQQSKLQLNRKSLDSDKENENSDTPIDLSKAMDFSILTETATSAQDDDIIMLSDDDDLPKLVNGFKEMSQEEYEKTKKIIRKLQEELRNEESKLVLLKKIRQSQVIGQTNVENTIPSKPPGIAVQSSRQGQVQQHHSQVIKSNQQPAHAHSNQTQTIQQQLQQRAHQQPAHANHNSANRHTSSRSTVVQSNSHAQVTQSSRVGSTSATQVSSYRGQQQQPPQKVITSKPEQSPAQRQAAAKLALRKQLEKTLLQIPPPKPPPPEMNFIPSSSSGDFVPLVGLEEVVKFIVEVDARAKGNKVGEVKYVFNPFTCVQCGTDFTPVWKRDKPGSKNVICEQCVTSNQKKALKQEHTNRLKSAFVKALQQEQEIEQRMQQAEKNHAAQLASAPNTQHSTSQSKQLIQGQQQRSTTVQPAPAHSSNTSSSLGTMSRNTSHSSSSGNSNSTNYKATQEQIRQHQNLLQAHQQQLRSLGLSGLQNLQNFAPHLAFPFQPQLQLTPKQAAELQRQYLLDMIQPRSVPGSTMWRNK